MTTYRTTIISTLAALAVFSCTQLLATEIYSWVDENGVQHFTQYRPGGDTPNVSTQQLEDTAPPGDGQPEDVYNLEEHEKRMAAWREEREQNRKDARESKQQAPQQQVRYPEQNNRYIRPYWYPPIYGRPPVKPPPKPEHPIEKPRAPPHNVPPRGISKR